MPTYDFKALSSYDFELLCRDLLQEELGLTLENFKPGKDKGIDLRYSEDLNSSLIVQCKHYAGTGFIGLLQELKKKEAAKIEKLNPKRYILTTSVPLTVKNKEEIFALLKPYVKTTADIFDQELLNNLLGKFPDIEEKNYKLWLTSTKILKNILHSSIYSQSKTEIENIKNKLKIYVQNESFSHAKKILKDHHYCIISGIPGIGKTTLAEILLIYYLDEGFDLFKVSSDIEQAFKVFDPVKKQVFYYDDFLGQTSLQEKLHKNEDQTLVNFCNLVGKSQNTRFILTTREYVLKQAKMIYEKIGVFDIEMQKCIVDLKKYTFFDRAKILYNHLYFLKIPEEYINNLIEDGKYLKIIKHENYSPRIVEWMTNVLNLRSIKPSEYSKQFLDNLDNPSKIWLSAFENQISKESRDLLIILATMPTDVLYEHLRIALFHFRKIKLMSTLDNELLFKKSLAELENTFIKIELVGSQNDKMISFHNPSIRDFVINYLDCDVDILDYLIHNCYYFNQLNRISSYYETLRDSIYSGVKHESVPIKNESYKYPLIRSYLKENIEFFIEQLIAKVDLDTWNVIFFVSGSALIKTRYSFEEKFILIIDTCLSIKPDLLKKIVPVLINKLKLNLRNKESNKQYLIKLINKLIEYNNMYFPCFVKLMDFLKPIFLNGLDTISDYEYFVEFKIIFKQYIEEKHVQQIRDDFDSFFMRDIELFYGSEDFSSIDEYKMQLEKIGEDLGLHVDEGIEELNIILKRIEEEVSEGEDYLYENWREAENESSILESEIANLFSSLEKEQ